MCLALSLQETLDWSQRYLSQAHEALPCIPAQGAGVEGDDLVSLCVWQGGRWELGSNGEGMGRSGWEGESWNERKRWRREEEGRSGRRGGRE